MANIWMTTGGHGYSSDEYTMMYRGQEIDKVIQHGETVWEDNNLNSSEFRFRARLEIRPYGTYNHTRIFVSFCIPLTYSSRYTNRPHGFGALIWLRINDSPKIGMDGSGQLFVRDTDSSAGYAEVHGMLNLNYNGDWVRSYDFHLGDFDPTVYVNDGGSNIITVKRNAEASYYSINFENLDIFEIYRPFPKGNYDITPTGIRSAFENCKNLKKIPRYLFHNLGDTQDISRVFYGCNSLEQIPIGLFDAQISANTFQDTFNGCSSIANIPSGLFDNTPNVTTFQDTFNGCSSIKEIPNWLFSQAASATIYTRTFANCTSLITIPPIL